MHNSCSRRVLQRWYLSVSCKYTGILTIKLFREFHSHTSYHSLCLCPKFTCSKTFISTHSITCHSACARSVTSTVMHNIQTNNIVSVLTAFVPYCFNGCLLVYMFHYTSTHQYDFIAWGSVEAQVHVFSCIVHKKCTLIPPVTIGFKSLNNGIPISFRYDSGQKCNYLHF